MGFFHRLIAKSNGLSLDMEKIHIYCIHASFGRFSKIFVRGVLIACFPSPCFLTLDSPRLIC